MEKRPHIKTRLPGPEAEKFLAAQEFDGLMAAQ